jgi:eukaryotic-like serine/threonine-protein kinase
MAETSERSRCSGCGAEGSAGELAGLCARCLLELAFEGAGGGVDAGLVTGAEGEVERGIGMMEEVSERIGRYRLIEPIGVGGFGRVYLAEQEVPVRRRVALKLIKLGMDTRQVVARFELERQALALMDHPNIAKVYDAGATDGGRPYFVMELVRGTPFVAYCDRERLTIRQRLELFIQVCEAIQHAHQKGIVHRDIKPSNIPVVELGGRPVPKVIDFGIAKAMEQPLAPHTLFTRHDQLVGTPAYMSPEQARTGGVDVDTRTDIYSLGVLLYELLAGRSPVDAETMGWEGLEGVRKWICETEPVRPSVRLNGMPVTDRARVAAMRGSHPDVLAGFLRGDLDWIVMKCLEKDRTHRYQTVNALAADLQRYLVHEPVLARPPSVSYRLRKLVQRHRAGLSLGAVVCFAALAAAASLVVSNVRIRGEAAARSKALVELERARGEARTLAEASQERLARLNYETGVRLVESGDYLNALAWLNEAVRLSGGGADLSRVTLGLMGAMLEQSPRLAQLWLHHGPVTHARFSRDGQWVGTAEATGTLRLWEVTTGSEVWVQPGGEPALGQAAVPPGGGAVAVFEFSPEGSRMLSVAGTEVRIWRVRDPTALPVVLAHPARVFHAAFNMDGTEVVTGAADATVRVWEADTGRCLEPEFRHAGGAVRFVTFHPGGAWLASSGDDDRARVWDRATGRQVGCLYNHRDGVSAGFPAGGEHFVAVGNSRDSRVQELADWSQEPWRPMHLDLQVHLALHPGRPLMAISCRDGTVNLWSCVDRAAAGVLHAHRDAVVCAGFSPDGTRLATASLDGTARAWRLDGRPLTPPLPHGGHVNWTEFSPDGESMVTASAEGLVRLWRLPGSESRTGIIPAVEAEEVVAICHEDGLVLLENSEVWDVTERRKVGVMHPAWEGVSSLTFVPGDRRIVARDRMGALEIRVYGPVGRVLPEWPVTAVALDPVFRADGNRVLLVGLDGPTWLVDVRTGSAREVPYSVGRDVSCAALSADGAGVLLCAAGGSVQLWESATGEVRSWRAPGDRALVLAQVLSQPGFVYAADRGGNGWVWSTTEEGVAPVPIPHQRAVVGAVFDAATSRMGTLTEDGAAHLWEIPSGRRLGGLLSHGARADRSLVLGSRLVHLRFSAPGGTLTSTDVYLRQRQWDAWTGLPLGPPPLYPTWSDAEQISLERQVQQLAAHRVGAAGMLEPIPVETLVRLWIPR